MFIFGVVLVDGGSGCALQYRITHDYQGQHVNVTITSPYFLSLFVSFFEGVADGAPWDSRRSLLDTRLWWLECEGWSLSNYSAVPSFFLVYAPFGTVFVVSL
jgi:hypothetical protein